MYITCVCVGQYLYPASCQSARLPSSEVPCAYCVLSNLQRGQQSNSFSRKTKSPPFFAGGCKKRMCNLVPWDKKKEIFYSIILYCKQGAWIVYSWRSGRIFFFWAVKCSSAFWEGVKRSGKEVHEGVFRRLEVKTTTTATRGGKTN